VSFSDALFASGTRAESLLKKLIPSQRSISTATAAQTSTASGRLEEDETRGSAASSEIISARITSRNVDASSEVDAPSIEFVRDSEICFANSTLASSDFASREYATAALDDIRPFSTGHRAA
jgi:DNA-binding transcriptional MocR family regulator